MARNEMPPDEAIRRLWSKFERAAGGCWAWTAHRDPSGYGRVNLPGRSGLAHRAMYEVLIGPVPDGLELDHLCRNRACVNPAHLEAVTHAENLARGATVTKAACNYGHEFTEANTIRRSTGHRACRACKIESDREYRRTRAAEINARRRARRANAR